MQANSVEKKLGYVFKDKSLLRTALTHGSYAHLHGGVSYDRMEYLGDALVDFIVAEELYRRHPDADEGELTKRRVALVSEQPLAAASRRLKLENEIAVLAHHMGKDSVLSDVFESLTAAIYLDGGMEPARKFVLDTLSELPEDNREDKDEKSALYEEFGHERVRFVEEGREGPAHRQALRWRSILTDNLSRALKVIPKRKRRRSAHDRFSKTDKEKYEPQKD